MVLLRNFGNVFKTNKYIMKITTKIQTEKIVDVPFIQYRK